MDNEQPAAGVFDIGTGPLRPDPHIMETGRVDLGVYHSDERFAAEKAIFGRVWLNVAETAEIADAGDWIVREVAVRSTSVLLVRGKDGAVRAFHNICSQRGMKLVWDSKGRGGKFSCPYHAWTYNSAGELLHIPDQDCFPHVDKTESGLSPIRCGTWEGMIFVNLDAAGTQSLDDYLGPLKERLTGVPFQSYPYTARVGSMIDATVHITTHIQRIGRLLLAKDREAMPRDALRESKAREKAINALAWKHALRHFGKIVSPFCEPSKRQPPRGVMEILAAGGRTPVPVPGSMVPTGSMRCGG